MKYIVSVRSSVIINTQTSKEAIDQIEDTLEDVRKRNCGFLEDEILAGIIIEKVSIEESDDE